MIRIHVPEAEFFDENKQEFINYGGCELRLEHSLISISKWESKWHKSFLSAEEKTAEETLDYIRCMSLDGDIPQSALAALSNENLIQIRDYINDPMTATWFSERNQPKGKRETVTSEVIYYWMISMEIPFECERWHLNRLLTLIRVCSIKNAPNKKMSKRELAAQNTALNKARRAKHGSKG